jgi:hypothetical protein
MFRRPLRDLLAVLAALVALWLGLPVVSAAIGLPPVSRATGLHGAYHVHSTRSDGRGDDEEIARAARAAGLDFVILTDHNLKELPPPRYREGVLLISAEELSTPVGHLVALGLPRALTEAERHEHAVDNVLALGGFPILAHPVQRHWPWQDWEAARRAGGIESISEDSLFRDALWHPLSRLAPAAVAYAVQPLFGLYGLFVDEPEARARMLEGVTPTHAMAALCGIDAHGLTSYRHAFESLSMHLPGPPSFGAPSLTAEAQAAASEVTRALTRGEAYCALDGLAPADGFARQTSGPFHPGQTVSYALPKVDAPTELRVSGPAHAVSGDRVLLDGEGAVQVEVWIRTRGLYLLPTWKPWIVPSPFFVSNG